MSGASSGNQTSSDDDENDDFPIAAIVCLGVGAYVILIIGIIILKQYCTSRGTCKSQCCDANAEEGNNCSCNCCAKANEACPCCCKCNLDGCLSKICGKPKKINCIDVLLCNCGGCTERNCNSFKCSVCCPKDVQCSCCCTQQICTNCFGCDDDASEPGTCGCLCLEVKFRSPRGGSTRRSTSAPPLFQQERFRQFNTHSGPGKDASFISNGKLSPIGRRRHLGDGDYENSDVSLSQDFVIGHGSNKGRSNNNNNVRLRSTSHSPKLSTKVRLKQVSNSPGKVFSESTPRDSAHGRESIMAKPQQKEAGERKGFEKQKSVSNNSNDSNSSIKISGASSNRRKSSKLRKSIRSGQRSQRFPNQTLVKSESLNTSNTSAQFETLKSHGRSLPEPSSNILRRPLPSINKASRTQ